MFRCSILFIQFVFVSISLLAQKSQTIRSLDSLLSKAKSTSILEKKVALYFDIADQYKDIEYYDSAQVWLNRISDISIQSKPSIFNYYIFSRRAEVHYYNGLNQLGITNAKRGLVIAENLNDRILLQDANNMLGLLFLSIDSIENAKLYFIKSVKNLTPPPYPKQYLYQTMPHHVFGNMAEIYEKLNKWDSAYYYSKLSLKEATDAKNERGISIANNSLANIYYQKSLFDSALYYYTISESVANKGNEMDVQLLNKAGMAKVYHLLGKNEFTKMQIQNGRALLTKFPKINTFFKREFLKEAKKLFQQLNDAPNTQEITEQLLKLEVEINTRHFNQIQYIINNSIETESRFVAAHLEQEKNAKQVQINRLSIIILVLLIVGILMAFYQFSEKEKLKVSILKNKISRDLHDDVGASLSSINMSASLVDKLMDIDQQKAKKVLKKISENAEDGISTLSDIVWAMKPVNDSGTSFESKIKNYGYSLLSLNDIECEYYISLKIDKQLTNIELKRNLLLLFKEAFNNIAKYSKAQLVVVKMEIGLKNKLNLQITDNGIGFDMNSIQLGNGIQNMERRVKAMGGEFLLESKINEGTTIQVNCKL